ncbi:CBS domain-containing protein [Streptomyces sp. NPDC005799]|uniref:CBS domain-containing protein n=1 Tax=Streptomyces sp. NPDC005799 TaxID=3154678 RepID=UPI0033E44327
MDDRRTREAGAASAEARRAVPSLARKPVEEFRQNLMVRYLHAMAAHDAQAAAEPSATGPEAPAVTPRPAERPTPPTELQVSHIAQRTVVGVALDTPFMDIARMLAREQLGAVPVVDAEGRVVGVVAESDLLARAAAQASSDAKPGTLGKLLGRRPRTVGGTAVTLMSAPALTAHPWTPVVEAARDAARSRVRQVFVTDHKGRLVGVVSRGELLHALVRDDAAIRDEVVSHVLPDLLGIGPARVDVEVHDGVVTLSGPVPTDLIPRLTDAVACIPDVLDVTDHLTAA